MNKREKTYMKTTREVPAIGTDPAVGPRGGYSPIYGDMMYFSANPNSVQKGVILSYLPYKRVHNGY